MRASQVNIDSLDDLESYIDKSLYPTFLQTVEIIFQDESDDASEDDQLCLPSEKDQQDALDWDVAVEELLESLKLEVNELDFEEQEQDEQTLHALTVNAADFKRRLAERQPTRISYVGLDARIALRDFLLSKMKEPRTEIAIAALGITLSWLFGRSLAKAFKELVVINDPFEELKAADNQSIILDIVNGCIWFKVNTTSAYPVNSADAVSVSKFIYVPDLLKITELQCLSLSESLLGANVVSSCHAIYEEVWDRFGITKSQIKNMLFESFLTTEGHGCTAALVADVTDMSTKVNLHYLTPKARFVSVFYVKALEEMTGLDPQKVIFPEHYAKDKFVGMHMCPSNGLVKDVIHKLSCVVHQPGEFRRAHNQITLATVMLLALSIGARDALGLNPNAFEVTNGGLCHYLEKDEMRLLVIPATLRSQLEAYDRHMKILRKVWSSQGGSSNLPEDLFFIFDEFGAPGRLHPKSFSIYLKQFAIDYNCPLNGLRRLLFTHLYQTFRFGAALDIYIGHACEGRRPWTEVCGVRLSTVQAISIFIEDFLSHLSWPIIEGCGHVHVSP